MRELIVRIAVKCGLYPLLVTWDTAIKEYIMGIRFRRHGLETLVAAHRVFEEAKVPMFLTFGTLLGAYRDKRFIPYDNDLDVGVLASLRPGDLIQRMQAAGFERTRQYYIPEFDDMLIEEQFVYKKVQIDIFYFFKEGEDYYTYITKSHETKDWREANRTDGFPVVRCYVTKGGFEKRPFLNHDFYFPSNTDKWLRDLYSDTYMTPIRNSHAWNQKSKTRIEPYPERAYRYNS